VAREHVTVVLTGEGSDESFGGYPRYQISRVRAALKGLPSALARTAALVLGAAPGRRAALLTSQLPLSDEEAMILNSAYVAPDLVARLVGRDPLPALAGRFELAASCRVEGNPIASLSRYEMSTYLGCALDRMDRMSMAHGLEGRVPFLDIPLVEWAARLDVRHKIRRAGGKHVVKGLASRFLSKKIVSARKSGFGLPLGAWFRSPPFADLIERLRDPRHAAAQQFDRAVIGQILDEHRRGVADHGEVLWLLSNVYLWYEEMGQPASVWARDNRLPASAAG
jgi:asparagine synthase (glutamine-hydrolysing)